MNPQYKNRNDAHNDSVALHVSEDYSPLQLLSWFETKGTRVSEYMENYSVSISNLYYRASPVFGKSDMKSHLYNV